MKPLLLIVDDDEDIRAQIRWALASDYEILLAEDRGSALKHFQGERPSVVLLDLGLPPHPGTPEEGLATLSDLLAEDPRAKVIILSGQSEKEVALRAVGGGAYDFLSKPIEMEELKPLLARCFHVAQLERDYVSIQRKLQDGKFEGMLGTSASMQLVFESIRKVATSDAPVLILGESGTGKEMAARAIHQKSLRRDEPFVAINCGAIPENLLESELFGHEKGAFTGAHIQRKGRIEHASDGTLFLDEVAELPAALQVKLLRFLQEQRIERVGGREEIPVNTRILAATNVDIEQSMRAGTFREDLYYRLAVVKITIPPLRERDDDVAMLAQSFLQRAALEHNRTGLTFSKEAVRSLRRYSWPGNVRELQNRVRRAVIMSEGRRLSIADMELRNVDGASPGTTLRAAREALERDMIRHALKRHSGKITAAAAELGVSRPTLYELMDKLGIERRS